MGRRRSGRDVHGIVLLDKPAGLTSSQAVEWVRRCFDARKAGHCGTLDPFATGMLPICLGEATKTAAYMLGAHKCYVGVACLGRATTTGDIDGASTHTCTVPDLDVRTIDEAMERFRGLVQQVPPMHSALKRGGRPLYELARKGVVVQREPREVTIHRLEVLEWTCPRLRFRVECSKGTYVRTLAEDLAQALGSCGHHEGLRRLWVQPFEARAMVSREILLEAAGSGSPDSLLLPVDAGLAAWPAIELGADDADRFRHGNPVGNENPGGWCRVYAPQGQLIGLGWRNPEENVLWPRRVFVFTDTPGGTDSRMPGISV